MVNGISKVNNLKGELAEYYVATLFNPGKSTLLQAIDNNRLTSWSTLTKKLIRKHLPKRIATVQRHLDQEFKIFVRLKQTNEFQEIGITPV